MKYLIRGRKRFSTGPHVRQVDMILKIKPDKWKKKDVLIFDIQENTILRK